MNLSFNIEPLQSLVHWSLDAVTIGDVLIAMELLGLQFFAHILIASLLGGFGQAGATNSIQLLRPSLQAIRMVVPSTVHSLPNTGRTPRGLSTLHRKPWILLWQRQLVWVNSQDVARQPCLRVLVLLVVHVSTEHAAARLVPSVNSSRTLLDSRSLHLKNRTVIAGTLLTFVALVIVSRKWPHFRWYDYCRWRLQPYIGTVMPQHHVVSMLLQETVPVLWVSAAVHLDFVVLLTVSLSLDSIIAVFWNIFFFCGRILRRHVWQCK